MTLVPFNGGDQSKPPPKGPRIVDAEFIDIEVEHVPQQEQIDEKTSTVTSTTNWQVTGVTLVFLYAILSLLFLPFIWYLPEVWSSMPFWSKVLILLLPLFALPMCQFTPKIDAVYTVTVFGKNTEWVIGPGMVFIFPFIFKTAELPSADQVDKIGGDNGFVLTCSFANQGGKNPVSSTTPKTRVKMTLVVHWRIIHPFKAQVKMGLQPGEPIAWGTDKDGNVGTHRKRLLNLVLPEIEKIIQTQAGENGGVEATDVVSGAYNKVIEGEENLKKLNAQMLPYGIRILKLSPSNPQFEREEDSAAVADAGREPLQQKQEETDAATTLKLYQQILGGLLATGMDPEQARERAWLQASATQGKVDLTMASVFQNIAAMLGIKLPNVQGRPNPGNRQNDKSGKKNKPVKKKKDEPEDEPADEPEEDET